MVISSAELSETFISSYGTDFSQISTEFVQVDCFLPNGIFISTKTSSNSTILDLKEDIWEEAERQPLFGHLRDKSLYVLNLISISGKTEELSDETRKLKDFSPYIFVSILPDQDDFVLLKVSERKQETEDENLNKSINSLIGKTLSEFKTLKNPEVNDFRYKISLLGEEIAIKRMTMTLKEKILYQYPPKVAKTSDIPNTVKPRLRDNSKFWIVARLPKDISFTFEVSCSMTPNQLLEMILSKKKSKLNMREKPKDYILKICGQEEYIFGEFPLIQFLHIQDTLSRDAVPTFVLMSINDVYVFTSNYYKPIEIPERSHATRTGSVTTGSTLRKKFKHESSWKIMDNFQITLQAISGLTYDSNRTMEVGIQAGLFHGGKSLCAKKQTQKDVFIQTNTGTGEWDESLTFDISVKNVPRMARLCLVVYETVKSSKSGGLRARRLKDLNKDLYIIPIAWVNTTVFDYKNQLKTGAVSLYTWTYTEDSADAEDLLHPLGTVEPNPRTDECASITLSFHNYNSDVNIYYPSEETVLKHAHMNRLESNLRRDIISTDERNIQEILTPYLNNDRLNDIPEQERNSIWDQREECMTLEPNGLNCLLYSVEWNNKDEVAEITSLLKEWPTLCVERALELLDYAYADVYVRRYAVECLKTVKDEELLLYLLQLVQAMKHESYLHCDLVEFLLQRALNNQRIGHFLFWHLRSEIQVPSVQIRFALILEAYLKSSREHISILMRQMNCLEKLKQGSELVKKGGKEKGKQLLVDFLKSQHVIADLSNVVSPLNPSLKCKTVKIDKVKVMDSKMRPIYSVFENVDQHGDDIYIIFKNGDDLRQDMLTLQMLRIMDRIWKANGMDFRMNTYSCISMDRRLGMIEVVTSAETIANIQKEKGMFSATSPFKKGSLFAWLKEHNPTDDLLQKAITEFTLSCAAYSVATYVLGVADRHSDNIMVKKTGQLFHIDFGHILGHFKEKFGFRRERVPFVLTHDFVYVINKGRSDKEADEFRKFQNLCERAFLTLRQHGTLILSLFAMMISTGLPELSSEKDLNYLRETLVLDYSEDDALQHFRSKFSEALANSWKTSLNWASHNFSKNNKQ